MLIPSWAPGFSAFGCACGDFEYRYDRSIDLPIFPGIDDATRMQLGNAINAAWDALADQVAAEFAKSGIPREQIRFKPAICMQYYGQLNDLEFRSPVQRIEEPGDILQLVRAFEDLYAKIYYNAARTPQFGYLATRAIMTGSVDVEKPALPHRVETGPDPDPEAQVGMRDVYWKGSGFQRRSLLWTGCTPATGSSVRRLSKRPPVLWWFRLIDGYGSIGTIYSICGRCDVQDTRRFLQCCRGRHDL